MPFTYSRQALAGLHCSQWRYVFRQVFYCINQRQKVCNLTKTKWLPWDKSAYDLTGTEWDGRQIAGSDMGTNISRARTAIDALVTGGHFLKSDWTTWASAAAFRSDAGIGDWDTNMARGNVNIWYQFYDAMLALRKYKVGPTASMSVDKRTYISTLSLEDAWDNARGAAPSVVGQNYLGFGGWYLNVLPPTWEVEIWDKSETRKMWYLDGAMVPEGTASKIAYGMECVYPDFTPPSTFPTLTYPDATTWTPSAGSTTDTRDCPITEELPFADTVTETLAVPGDWPGPGLSVGDGYGVAVRPATGPTLYADLSSALVYE